MNFCSTCGSREIGLLIPQGDSRHRYVCKDCGVIHYQNPKIVAGCLPIFEDKILLCRRSIEPRKGFWNIPAGFMENDESVEEGALREVWEEAQAKVEIKRLFAVYNILPVNQVYIIFLANLPEPRFFAGEESAEVRLFRFDEIPMKDLAFDSNKFVITKYLENKDFEGVHIGSYNRPF